LADSEMVLLGVPEMAQNISVRMKRMRGESTDNLERFAEYILEQAKNLCPIKSGALRNSGQVQRDANPNWYAEGHYHQRAVHITFGDDTVDYAIPVHERLDVRHPVGQAKFLETPLLAAHASFAMNIKGGGDWW
jgi:hypothetical protein